MCIIIHLYSKEPIFSFTVFHSKAVIVEDYDTNFARQEGLIPCEVWMRDATSTYLEIALCPIQGWVELPLLVQ